MNAMKFSHRRTPEKLRVEAAVETTVRVPLHKRRIALQALGGLVVVIGTAAAVILALSGNLQRYADLPHYAAAGIAIVGGVAALLRAVARLQDSEDGLVVGPRGIRLLHEYSGTHVGPIPWSAVTRLESRRHKRHRYIAVHLDAPERFLPPTGFLGGALRRLSTRVAGSSIIVSARWLQIAPDQLETLLRRYFEHYGRHAA